MVHFLGLRCHSRRCRPLTWCFRYFWCLMVSHFSQGLFYFQSHSDDGERANPCASRSRCWGRDPEAIRNCCWSCMWDWYGILEWGIEELKCSNDFKPLFVAHWTSFNQQQLATEHKPGLYIVITYSEKKYTHSVLCSYGDYPSAMKCFTHMGNNI